MTNNLFTSASAPESHPDKIANPIWDDFAEQDSIGFRLKSCWPQDQNKPMAFFGTENGQTLLC